MTPPPVVALLVAFLLAVGGAIPGGNPITESAPPEL